MFSFHGGLPWIDFINTQYMSHGEVRDGIEKKEDLLRWYSEAGIEIPEDALQGWNALWPPLCALRAQLRELAEETAATQEVAPRHVERLNEQLEAIPGKWQIGGGEAVFIPLGHGQERFLWPLLKSAMDFLAGQQLTRLKKCGNHQCIQYYYDTSKNNTRRWCRMEVCGNREKAKRHYRKKCSGGLNDE